MVLFLSFSLSLSLSISISFHFKWPLAATQELPNKFLYADIVLNNQNAHMMMVMIIIVIIIIVWILVEIGKSETIESNATICRRLISWLRRILRESAMLCKANDP